MSIRVSSKVVATHCLLFSLVGCGASHASHGAGTPGDDAGGDDAGAVDDGGCGQDAGADASFDVSAPVGRQLQMGDALSLRQVTSDGYVVYSDDAALQLFAIPLAGGNPMQVASLGSPFWVTGIGRVVFAWSNVSSADVGALTVWSAATGPHTVSSASLGIDATASPDGTSILYLDNVDATAQTGDVYVASIDGTGAAKLLGGQSLTGCFPQLGFAGSYVLVSHCDTARGPGPSSTISSFQSPGWGRTDLVTKAANYWSVDDASTTVLVSTSNGVLTVPIAGGTPMMIDGTGFMGQLISGGKTAIYSTMSHALRSSPVSMPSPTTLVTTFGGFYGLSADESTVLFFQNFGSAGADVYLASATAPSTPMALWADPTGAVNGDAFTSDSAHALYSAGTDSCTHVGALNAFPVGGGAPRILGHNVWADWAATGGKVVFDDNYVATGGLRFGRADIESVDLSQSAEPTRIVGGADAVMSLTPSKDQIVYSWSAQPGAQAGLYVTPVP